MEPSATTAPLPVLQLRHDQAVPILVLPEALDFEGLRAWLVEQMPAHQDELSGRTARLDLGQREVQLLELRRLIHFLRETWSVEITGLYLLPDVLHKFAERELRLKLFVREGDSDDGDAETAAEDAATETSGTDAPTDGPLAALTLPNDLSPEDLVEEPAPAMAEPTHRDGSRRTLSLNRTLRSGAVVRFDGDVYVFGDVNPGAHVVATGNLVVLGALKGMAWAGAAGEDDAVIVAHLLRPTQLRIGRKIAIVPERGADSAFQPEMASVLDGEIVIEPYRAKLRNTPSS